MSHFCELLRIYQLGQYIIKCTLLLNCGPGNAILNWLYALGTKSVQRFFCPGWNFWFLTSSQQASKVGTTFCWRSVNLRRFFFLSSNSPTTTFLHIFALASKKCLNQKFKWFYFYFFWPHIRGLVEFGEKFCWSFGELTTKRNSSTISWPLKWLRPTLYYRTVDVYNVHYRPEENKKWELQVVETVNNTINHMVITKLSNIITKKPGLCCNFTIWTKKIWYLSNIVVPIFVSC